MTVILAVRCAQGLVLATNSQATAQIAGGMPVKQETTKLVQLGPDVLFAGTGAQGCSQRVEAPLAASTQQFGQAKSRQEIGTLIHQLANQVQKQSAAAFVQYAATAQPESWGGIFYGLALESGSAVSRAFSMKGSAVVIVSPSRSYECTTYLMSGSSRVASASFMPRTPS